MSEHTPHDHSLMIQRGHGEEGQELAARDTAGLPHYAVAVPMSSQREPERIVISLEEVVLLVKQHFFKAVIFGILLAGLAFSYFQFRDPVFVVSTMLRIQPTSQKTLNLNSLDKQIAFDDPVEEKSNTFRVEMASTKFRTFFFKEEENREIIDRFLAGQKPGMMGLILGAILPADDSGEKASPLEDFLEGVDNDVTADPVKETHLLRVTVTHGDPKVAAEFANAYTSSFLRYITIEEKKGMEQATVFLGEHLKGLLGRVKEKEKELLDFRRTERLVSSRDPGQNEIKGVDAINAKILDTKLKISHLEETLARVDAAEESRDALLSIDEIAALPGVETIQKKLAEKSAELISLESSYEGTHSRVIQAKREVNGLELQLKRLISEAVSQISAELKTEFAKLEAVSGEFLSAENTALDQQQKELKQEILEMQLTAERNLYDRLSSQLSEAQVALQFSGSGDLRIAEEALPPKRAVSPRLLVSLVLSGMAFGFGFVGFPVMAFGWGYLRDLLKRAEEKETEKKAAAMSKPTAPEKSLPATSLNSGTEAARPPVQRDSRNLIKMPVLAAMDSSELIRLGIQTDTPHGEAIHRFNSALLQDSRFPALLVTSATPREGKTLISIALACSAAAAGRKVFLVEANEMNPCLQEWFRNKQADPGKVDNVSEALDMTKVGESGLHVITRNHWRSNYEVYSDMLDQAPNLCDAVYLDGPALVHSDAWAFQKGNAKLAVVVRDTQRPPQGVPGLATAQVMLSGHGTKVIGEISNRNQPSSSLESTYHFANYAT